MMGGGDREAWDVEGWTWKRWDGQGVRQTEIEWKRAG